MTDGRDWAFGNQRAQRHGQRAWLAERFIMKVKTSVADSVCEGALNWIKLLQMRGGVEGGKVGCLIGCLHQSVVFLESPIQSSDSCLLYGSVAYG